MSSYRVWDVANGVDPDFPGDGKCVDPVNGDSVLVFQQVDSVYCHLQVKAARCDGPHNSALVMPKKKLRMEKRLTLKTSSSTRTMASNGAPHLKGSWCSVSSSPQESSCRELHTTQGEGPKRALKRRATSERGLVLQPLAKST